MSYYDLAASYYYAIVEMYFLHVCVCPWMLAPQEASRGHWFFWSWWHRGFWAVWCGNRSQVFCTSSKSTLNHRAFSNLELIDKHFLEGIQNPRFILDWVSLKFEEVPMTYTYKALILWYCISHPVIIHNFFFVPFLYKWKFLVRTYLILDPLQGQLPD